MGRRLSHHDHFRQKVAMVLLYWQTSATVAGNTCERPSPIAACTRSITFWPLPLPSLNGLPLLAFLSIRSSTWRVVAMIALVLSPLWLTASGSLAITARLARKDAVSRLNPPGLLLISP